MPATPPADPAEDQRPDGGGYLIAYVPEHYVCSLTDLIKVVGSRWAIEYDFQDAKQAIALDQTQVRGYRVWK